MDRGRYIVIGMFLQRFARRVGLVMFTRHGSLFYGEGEVDAGNFFVRNTHLASQDVIMSASVAYR